MGFDAAHFFVERTALWIGDYNDDALEIEVTVPYVGAIEIVGFVDGDPPSSLILRDSNGDIVGADGDSSDPDGDRDGLRLFSNVLPVGTYYLDLEGDDGEFGNYSVELFCETGSPTVSSSPTLEPTATPTVEPTAFHQNRTVSCGETTAGSFCCGTATYVPVQIDDANAGTVTFDWSLTTNSGNLSGIGVVLYEDAPTGNIGDIIALSTGLAIWDLYTSQ